MKIKQIKWKKLLIPVLVGLIIWLCSPIKPQGIPLNAWHILAIFVATVIGCITQPFPIAGVSIIGLTIMILTGTVSMEKAASGFGNTVVWMIAMAYFMSRGFIKTGLGRRVGLLFIRLFGKKSLGLAYSLIGIDLITAPATPSSAARAGGIVFPIIKSIAKLYHSDPKDHTQRKIGSFLIFAEFHGDLINSGLFMTAMAPNLVVVGLAKPFGLTLSWSQWLLAALAPAIISLIAVPYFIYKMYPPEIKDTPHAGQWAEKELKTLGKITPPEKIMLSIFILALVLWMLSSFIGLDATLVAFIAVSLLVLSGVLTVKDLLNESSAWNVLLWISILVFMANQLDETGLIPWLENSIGNILENTNWIIVLVVLMLFYFYSHYLFASGTAHVSAMYSALLGIAVSVGAPKMLSAYLLGFTAAIFSSTTHYASGTAALLFGPGYVDQTSWWKMNFILGIFYLLVWGIIGTFWMKLIGVW